MNNNLNKIYPFFLAALNCVFVKTFAQEQPALKDVFKNYFLIGAALNTQQILQQDILSITIN